MRSGTRGGLARVGTALIARGGDRACGGQGRRLGLEQDAEAVARGIEGSRKPLRYRRPRAHVLAPRVGRPVVHEEFVVQVRPGREPRGADIADRFPLGHALTRAEIPSAVARTGVPYAAEKSTPSWARHMWRIG